MIHRAKCVKKKEKRGECQVAYNNEFRNCIIYFAGGIFVGFSPEKSESVSVGLFYRNCGSSLMADEENDIHVH